MGSTRQAGFTIIELLIVVVVIAILAAVTLVSYGNIQARAVTSRTVQSGSMYNKALLSYKALNGVYPPLSVGVGGACLGENYTDRNSDGIGDCGETAYPLRVDTTFNTALKNIMSSLPIVNDKAITMPYQASTWVGMTYHYYPPDPLDTNPQTTGGFMVNGVSNPNYVMYVVDGGNTNCALANLVAPDESQSGWPKMTTTLPGGQKWSWSDGKTTACVAALPN